MITSVSAALSRVKKALAAYPELAAVLVAAIVGLSVQRPLAWLAARQGIDVLLAILVFATAVTIDPAALRRAGAAWRHLLAAVAVGITVLPALSWAAARLVAPGPLRDGVLTVGLAPCEIASVATTALAGGEAAVAAGVLIGSTLATVALAGPILTLEAGAASSRAALSPAGIMASLALIVALPLAVGLAARAVAGTGSPVVRLLATPRAQSAASLTALISVAALVALVASEVHLTASYAAVAAALVLFLLASALVGRALGARTTRPARAGLLLTTSMRDFAIAAGLATAAFGPAAAAPLGLYGIAVLIWGVALAGALRHRTRSGNPPSACELA
jgi:predicted Na+-dependent transporter